MRDDPLNMNFYIFVPSVISGIWALNYITYYIDSWSKTSYIEKYHRKLVRKLNSQL